MSTAPPVVTPSGTTGSYAVGSTPLAVDSGVTVFSYDTDLTGATVTISAGTLQSGDTLNFTNQNGISGGYSGGVLTLSGSATPAQYQTALRSVTFTSTTTNPAITTRAISIVALDNALTSNTAAESLNVGRNFVIPSGLATNYTFGAPPAHVDQGRNGIVQRFPTGWGDGDNLVGTLQSGDILDFTSPVGSGIGGVYSGGVLTLSGSATVAQYQTALQSVKFYSTGTNTTTRSISMVTIDGALYSNIASETINVSAPITITALYVNGTGWSTFDKYLGSQGYGSATLGYALLPVTASSRRFPGAPSMSSTCSSAGRSAALPPGRSSLRVEPGERGMRPRLPR